MTNKTEIILDTTLISNLLKDLDLKSQKQLQSKVATALNYATRHIRKESVSIMRKDLGLPRNRLTDRQFKLVRAKPDMEMEATLYVTGTPIPLVEFDGVKYDEDSITTKYTSKAIKAKADFEFRETNWFKIQAANDARVRAGDDRQLNFLDKKNAARKYISVISLHGRKDAGSSSAFKGSKYGTSIHDEMFGISASAAIAMQMFQDKFDIYDQKIIQRDFDDKLDELLNQ